jgi:hypothetical protein
VGLTSFGVRRTYFGALTFARLPLRPSASQAIVLAVVQGCAFAALQVHRHNVVSMVRQLQFSPTRRSTGHATACRCAPVSSTLGQMHSLRLGRRLRFSSGTVCSSRPPGSCAPTSQRASSAPLHRGPHVLRRSAHQLRRPNFLSFSLAPFGHSSNSSRTRSRLRVCSTQGSSPQSYVRGPASSIQPNPALNRTRNGTPLRAG